MKTNKNELKLHTFKNNENVLKWQKYNKTTSTLKAAWQEEE